MNLAARLTLDGLIRALRWQAHALAEDVERGYGPGGRDDPADKERRPPRARRPKETDDGVAGE